MYIKHSTAKLRISPKAALFIVVAFGILGLVVNNMRDRILGTPLIVTTASDGATVESPFLPISGFARHAREILINGRPIAVTREGTFNDEVVLSKGYNIVEIALKDQFGNQKIKTYQIVVSPPDAVALTTPY